MSNIQPKEFGISGRESDDFPTAGRREPVLLVGLLEHDGEPMFCVIKNISASGVRVMPYGSVVEGTDLLLRVSDESPVPARVAWSRDGVAGLQFERKLDAAKLLRIGRKMVTPLRRTAARVATTLEGCLRTGGEIHFVTICELSVAGARLRTVRPIMFGDSISIEVPCLPSLRARLRWADDTTYGVTFLTPLPRQIIGDLLSAGQYPPGA